MSPYVFFNGEILPKEQIVVGLNDLGLLRGYGMFDFFPISNGKPVFFEDYLARFLRSAEKLYITIPYSSDEIEDFIYRTIKANELKEGYCRFLLTGGYSQDGYHCEEAMPNFWMILYPPIHHPSHLFNEGVKLLLVEHVRSMAEVKRTNYVRAMMERSRLKKEGAFDVLFAQNGWISESSRANFFIVDSEGHLVTPDRNILFGVTRKRLIELASKHLEVQERPIHIKELTTAKEAFITSTTKATLPIVQVDEITIGDGRPGPIADQLRNLYQLAVHEDVGAQ